MKKLTEIRTAIGTTKIEMMDFRNPGEKIVGELESVRVRKDGLKVEITPTEIVPGSREGKIKMTGVPKCAEAKILD